MNVTDGHMASIRIKLPSASLEEFAGLLPSQLSRSSCSFILRQPIIIVGDKLIVPSRVWTVRPEMA